MQQLTPDAMFSFPTGSTHTPRQANNWASANRVFGGIFDRTDTTLPAIKFAPGDTLATPRSLVGVYSTGVLVDLAGGDNCLVTGCFTRNILFGISKKALVVGTRISTVGATLSITGTEAAVTGCAIAGNVEFGAGASNCQFAASPIAGGFSFADNSGNSTNFTDYIFRASATYDPISLPAGGGQTTTVTCAGAKVGMFARGSFSQDLQGMTLSAYVSAANTVTVRFQNGSGGSLNIASGTLSVQAFA